MNDCEWLVSKTILQKKYHLQFLKKNWDTCVYVHDKILLLKLLFVLVESYLIIIYSSA